MSALACPRCGWENTWTDSGDLGAAQDDHDRRCPEEVVEIFLEAGSAYRANNYGVVLVSTTTHNVSGPSVHNPSFQHQVEVWLNTRGTDPSGKPTTDLVSFYLSAQPSVIALYPQVTPPRGPALRTDQVVRLTLKSGSTLGLFKVSARAVADPILIKVQEA